MISNNIRRQLTWRRLTASSSPDMGDARGERPSSDTEPRPRRRDSPEPMIEYRNRKTCRAYTNEWGANITATKIAISIVPFISNCKIASISTCFQIRLICLFVCLFCYKALRMCIYSSASSQNRYFHSWWIFLHTSCCILHVLCWIPVGLGRFITGYVHLKILWQWKSVFQNRWLPKVIITTSMQRCSEISEN